MGRYFEGTSAAEVTGFVGIPLAIAISAEVAAVAAVADRSAGSAGSAADMADVENAVFVVDAVRAYVDFLSATGRWSGPADQLAEIMEFFDDLAEGDDGHQYLEVPEFPDEQALEVFSGLPLIQQATALLEWIGDGKPVTGTGALRLRDIEAAAACVGVAVKGAAGKGTAGRGTDSPLPGTAGSADDVPTVRSMYEVPQLAKMWAALEAAELIEFTSTKVVPFEDSGAFLTGGTSERLEELVFFVDQYLETAVLGWDPEQPWEQLVSGLQASILLAAATADPPEKARVLAAPDNAPAAEKAMAGLLTGMALRRLEDLAGLGLLSIDTHFRVPPALIRCVANDFDDEWVLADLGITPAPEDAGPEPVEESAVVRQAQAPVERKVVMRQTAAQQAAAPVLQLKIMLDDSKPPIWRRVLVPAGTPLTELHQVIQALFGWYGYHLHQFQAGGFRGPTYAPADPDGRDDLYGDSSLDEAAVTAGELLPDVGSTLSYTYDFGDNWVHVVTVEKILADDGGGRLPRCTAGRGAAPAEDSGGIWGWTNIVQAVNDPGHEEHKEYREWLGMRPGDSLDPKAFDMEEANQGLAKLS